MSFYDGSAWGASGNRHPSWEHTQQQAPPQQTPPQQQQQQQQPSQSQTPSRSGSSSIVQITEPLAFNSQIEEVDRACDNLAKSGKLFGAPGRRDSMPLMMGGPHHRMGPQRHSISEYDGFRPQSASSLQGFYANQRYQPRPNENDGVVQKRRMAAQRERELRNYHQEQQFNRNISASTKSERSVSPNAMNEDNHRELLSRQHQALYGKDSALYNAFPGPPNEAGGPARQRGSQDARVPQTGSAGRNQSPLAFDHFGVQSSTGMGEPQSAVQMPSRDKLDASAGSHRSRANSTSPSSNPPPSSFALFEAGAAHQSSRTSNSSPNAAAGAGSPPGLGNKGPGGNGAGAGTNNVAPIGTRPSVSGAAGQAGPAQQLAKRSTTPLPSPLSYGFNAGDQNGAGQARNSAQGQTQGGSTPSSAAVEKGTPPQLGWNSNSAVWGSGKGPLNVQASAWG